MYRDLPVTVGVDDDPSSDEAIGFAAREALAAGARLRMLHAWMMPTPVLEGSMALLASPLEVKEEHRRILKNAVRRVEETHPQLEVEGHLVPEYAGTALTRAAESSSLVVIGTHRRGIFAGAVLGSVGADLIGRTACPVAVVPAPADLAAD
jgi:nucleotide-binding universal stress UspA family protein